MTWLYPIAAIAIPCGALFGAIVLRGLAGGSRNDRLAYEHERARQRAAERHRAAGQGLNHHNGGNSNGR